MRYCFLLIAVVLAVPVYAADYNESVAAISYNPSRLGAYSHLKVVNKATLAGGVDAQTNSADVNIMTTGTVEFKNSDNQGVCSTGSGCYEITTIDSMAREEGCSNYSDLCSVADPYTASLTTQANTVVQGGNTPYVAKGDLPDIANNDTFPTNTGVTVEMKGGNLTSTSSTFVRTLTGNLAKIELYSSDKLIMNGGTTLYVQKVTGDSTTPSFKLGNTTITAPSTASSGTFSWQIRTDKNGKRANVLAFQ